MKKTVLLSSLLLSIMSIGSPVYNLAESFVVARAEEASNPDKSDIYSDLKNVDLSSYKVDSKQDNFDVVQIMEYGFNNIDSYSLYLYVFNKSGKLNNYYFAHNMNRVEMLFSNYENKHDSYEHINVSFVSRTSDYKFIKYRIDVPSYDSFLSNQEEIIRTYTIVGLEMVKSNDHNIGFLHDYSICHQWNYIGLDNPVVTYSSEVEHLQLHKNDILGGSYIFNAGVSGSAIKGYFQNMPRTWYWDRQLSYVCFRIPNEFDNIKYNLYSVHADYYKYDLGKLVYYLMDDHPLQYYEDLYLNGATYDDIVDFKASNNGNKLNKIAHAYFNKKFNNFHEYGTWQYLWDTRSIPYKFYLGIHDINSNMEVHLGKEFDSLVNNFYSEGQAGNIGRKDAFAFPISDYDHVTTSSEISEYIDIDICEALTGITAESKQNYKEIHYTNDANPLNDAEYKTFDLTGIGSSVNFVANYFIEFNSETINTNITNLPCLEEISKEDIELSNSDFSEKYYVSSEQSENIKSLINTSNEQESTYVFRFDTTKQEYCDVYYNYLAPNGAAMVNTGTKLAKAGYYYSEYEAIIDFDIIDFTYVNDAKQLKNIPVVGDPINILPETPAVTYIKENNWWKIILSIIIAVLIIVTLIWIIVKVIKFVNHKQQRKATKAILRQSKKKKRRKY